MTTAEARELHRRAYQLAQQAIDLVEQISRLTHGEDDRSQKPQSSRAAKAELEATRIIRTATHGSQAQHVVRPKLRVIRGGAA